MLCKDSVLTLHNLGKDDQHWVSFVVDGEAHTILFGNSYGTDIPPELLNTYQWWFSQHSATPFTLKALTISFQEPHNTSSCRFLSHNSLECFAFPSTVPLIASNNIQAARMKAFVSIAGQVLEQVCYQVSCWNDTMLITSADF